MPLRCAWLSARRLLVILLSAPTPKQMLWSRLFSFVAQRKLTQQPLSSSVRLWISLSIWAKSLMLFFYPFPLSSEVMTVERHQGVVLVHCEHLNRSSLNLRCFQSCPNRSTRLVALAVLGELKRLASLQKVPRCPLQFFTRGPTEIDERTQCSALA